MPALRALAEINPSTPKPPGIVPLIGLADIDTVTASATPRAIDPAESDRARRMARPGDVLFARISPSMENGKLALVPDLEAGAVRVSGELFVLRAKPGVDPWLIWAFLRWRPVRERLRSSMVGTTRPRVPREVLEELDVPLVEHWSTARVIMDRLDSALVARRATLDPLRNLARAVVAGPSASVGRRPLAELGAAIKPGGNQSTLEEGAFPVLRAGNLADGTIHDAQLRFLANPPSENDLLRDGDLLVARLSGSPESFAASAVYEGRPSRAAAAASLIRVRTRSPSADFLWAWLQTVEAHAYCLERAAGSTQRFNLRLPRLRSLPVPDLGVGEFDRLGRACRSIRLALGTANYQFDLLQRAIQAHLARRFGEALASASPAASIPVFPGGSSADLLPVYEAASVGQRAIWDAVTSGRSVPASAFSSERERARLQEMLNLLEQLGVVIRDRRDEIETWHLVDPETELVS